MATVIVPTTSDHERFIERVQLEGLNFVLRIRYNSRMGEWILDLFDTDQNALVRSRAAVLDWDLFQQFGHLTTLPPGFMNFFDTTGGGARATRTDLSTRVILLYTDLADIANLTQAQVDALFG